MDRLHRIARQQILTDRMLGATTLPMPMIDLAKAMQAAPASPASPAAASQSHRPPAASADRSAPRPSPTQPAAIRPANNPQQDMQAVRRTPASRTGSTDLPPPATADTSPAAARPREARLQLLQTLDESQVRGCQKCVLCEKRTQTVFGEGNPQAQLMFIGEGPGEQEDKLGRPFVGPAGELLDKMIVAMGLSREEVYIANAVKCRPPGNRPPAPEETQACSKYLNQQIAIVRPRIIVTLGAPATKLMLNTTMGISGIRGRWHDFNFTDEDGQTLNIPIMPTFHPSYVLRRYTVEVRKTVWEDLQQAMAYLKQL